MQTEYVGTLRIATTTPHRSVLINEPLAPNGFIFWA